MHALHQITLTTIFCLNIGGGRKILTWIMLLVVIQRRAYNKVLEFLAGLIPIINRLYNIYVSLNIIEKFVNVIYDEIYAYNETAHVAGRVRYLTFMCIMYMDKLSQRGYLQDPSRVKFLYKKQFLIIYEEKISWQDIHFYRDAAFDVKKTRPSGPFFHISFKTSCVIETIAVLI